MSDAATPTPRTVIDFHAHWLPVDLVGRRPPAAAQGLIRELWDELVDPASQVEAVERDGIDLRFLSSPLEMLTLLDLPDDSISLARRSNDLLADFVAEHPDRFAGLATVDPFSGDAGAEEARRAVDDLSFRGLFLATVEGERLLDDPAVVPTLEFAAERAVPVFAHPVNPPVLPPRYADVAAGHALGRAAESAISLLALLASGTLSRLPDLHIVIAQLSSAALLLAHYVDPTPAPPEGTWKPSDDRARLYVDVAGFEPIAVRAALEAVGVDHLLIGTDNPVYGETPIEMISRAVLAGGVDPADLDKVGSENAAGLLGLGEPSSVAGKV
jgi:predicted TIM-barrel fold metal-dependent hydrolase